MRTASEWEAELAARRARLRVNTVPWLRDLLVRLVWTAKVELQRARRPS